MVDFKDTAVQAHWCCTQYSTWVQSSGWFSSNQRSIAYLATELPVSESIDASSPFNQMLKIGTPYRMLITFYRTMLEKLYERRSPRQWDFYSFAQILIILMFNKAIFTLLTTLVLKVHWNTSCSNPFMSAKQELCLDLKHIESCSLAALRYGLLSMQNCLLVLQVPSASSWVGSVLENFRAACWTK